MHRMSSNVALLSGVALQERMIAHGAEARIADPTDAPGIAFVDHVPAWLRRSAIEIAVHERVAVRRGNVRPWLDGRHVPIVVESFRGTVVVVTCTRIGPFRSIVQCCLPVVLRGAAACA